MDELKKTYEIEYPFVRDEHCDSGWRPGTQVVVGGDHWTAECRSATADGKARLTVVSQHEPGGKYHKRIFYTRKWVSPDGKEFGRSDLQVATIGYFKRIINGYTFEYDLDLDLIIKDDGGYIE